MAWAIRPDGAIDDITGDGTCFIELSSTDPDGSDLWTPNQFRRAAFRMMEKCVFADRNEGGSAYRLGLSFSLLKRSKHQERLGSVTLLTALQDREESSRWLSRNGLHMWNAPYPGAYPK